MLSDIKFVMKLPCNCRPAVLYHVDVMIIWRANISLSPYHLIAFFLFFSYLSSWYCYRRYKYTTNISFSPYCFILIAFFYLVSFLSSWYYYTLISVNQVLAYPFYQELMHSIFPCLLKFKCVYRLFWRKGKER